MSAIRKHHYYILKLVNDLSGSNHEKLSDIPHEKFCLLKDMDYLTVAMPYIIHDINTGLSIAQVTIKYSISTQAVRTISKKHKVKC